MKASTLDRVIEVVLTTGLLVSAALLVAGLALGRVSALRAGVLLLMLTPVARVVVVTVGLAQERDWPFAFASLVIFGILCSSILLAWRM